MFRRFCLLCLLYCRCVIGRLPVDVLPINTFTGSAAHSVSQFSGVYSIVDVDRNYYVLSKNQVSSLKVSSGENGKTEHNIQKIIEWPSSSSADNLCQHKTRDVEACNNFVRIFAPKDDSKKEFIVCGTHSFQPMCRIYTKQQSTFKSSEEFSGSSICPFDPKQTGASIYTGGNLYSATVKDFLGRKPVIYRHDVNSGSQDLERTKRDETWLLDPSFVNFVETNAKVYIFFKESAAEANNGLRYSRVAQICKADEGGDHILRKQFTSYQKARLNCSFPGNPPFYFDELKAVTDFVELPNSSGQKILFAAMNTPSNSIWGSAVCAFMEKDIEDTFQQPYLEQHTGTEGVSYWSEKESDQTVKDALSKCQFDSRGKPILSDENLLFVKDHPLISHSVPTWAQDGKTNVPIFMKLNAMYQFTAIAIDTNAGSNGLYFVIILGTTDGKTLKIVPPLSKSITESHFVGETTVYDEVKCGEGDKQVQDVKIDKQNGFILVAFSSCVISVPLCPIKSTCQKECIAAQDPYCAWDGNECVNVLRPEGLQQDVINGDVIGLPECPSLVPIPGVDGEPGETTGKSGNKASTNVTTGSPNNVTAAAIPVKDLTTAVAVPIVKPAGVQSSLIHGIIGAIIGIVVTALIFFIYLRRKKSTRKSKDNRQDGGIVTTRAKNGKNSKDSKRNSQSSAQSKQDRINTNSTRRQNSKRSESSLEDDPFIDGNLSEGNVNSLEKSKRKREKSANRKSNASSYRREDSLEKPHNISVNRQTSRESNRDPSPNNEDSLPEHDHMFSSSEYVQQHPQQQSQSPPQNTQFRRTFSTGNGRQDGMIPRQNGRQQVKRQLSLQMPMNSMNTNPVKFYPALTPVRLGTQNPLEIYNQQQQQQMQGNFDPAQAPGWHPSAIKNPHGLPRQYQTTSLDRKMLKAGGMAHPQQHHDAQQQPRNYSDTLPASGMDDMKAQGRRRYPSESVVIGNNTGRPPPIFFASKQPTYQSIEEEASPLPEQHSPTKYPTNNMPQRNTARMRPNHLPLGNNTNQPIDDPRSPYTVIPYSNPGTPMTEQIPLFAMSPHQNAGYTLPSQLRRQYTVDAPSTRYNSVPPNPRDFNKQFPHPQSAPNIKSYSTTERQSKSNPATPEWDGNHNNFFTEPVVTAAEMRNRNPSGKSQGTPNTPPIKNIQNFIHPDVIPTNNKRTDGRGPADGVTDPAYMITSENKPMESHA